MRAYDVLGYAYDADLHCPNCGYARFGARLDDDTNPPQDNEGNNVHPLFAGDEYDPAGEYCGDCGAEIVEPDDDTDDDE